MVIKDNFLPFNPEFSKLVVNKGCKLRKRPNFCSKYLTIMYQSRVPYQICKALRAETGGFSNFICPEGLVHSCFKIPLQNVLYSIKLKFVTFMP